MTSRDVWRVGRHVGRTVYRQTGTDPDGTDVLIGVMDTPELARQVVDAVNRAARVAALLREWRGMDPAASLDAGEVVAELDDALNG